LTGLRGQLGNSWLQPPAPAAGKRLQGHWTQAVRHRSTTRRQQPLHGDCYNPRPTGARGVAKRVGRCRIETISRRSGHRLHASTLSPARRPARMGESELDQALVERVKNGDKRAFDLLVRKYQHKIVSVVTRYVSDWSEAQDVAQEAFIRAYRAMGAFRGDSAFYTWIYKIAI